MKTKILAAVLVAVSATVAAPAFASGYGPAPFYSPSIGAPASQRGQSEQTVAADDASTATNRAYGGVNEQTTQSGTHASVSPPFSLFRHH